MLDRLRACIVANYYGGGAQQVAAQVGTISLINGLDIFHGKREDFDTDSPKWAIFQFWVSYY